MFGTVIIFMSLEFGGSGANGFRIKTNASDCQHLHGFGSGRNGGGWPQNHRKCKGMLSFSWFWKWAGGEAAGVRIIRNDGIVIIFMVLKAPARGAVGSG